MKKWGEFTLNNFPIPLFATSPVKTLVHVRVDRLVEGLYLSGCKKVFNHKKTLEVEGVFFPIIHGHEFHLFVHNYSLAKVISRSQKQVPFNWYKL